MRWIPLPNLAPGLLLILFAIFYPKHHTKVQKEEYREGKDFTILFIYDHYQHLNSLILGPENEDPVFFLKENLKQNFGNYTTVYKNADKQKIRDVIEELKNSKNFDKTSQLFIHFRTWSFFNKNTFLAPWNAGRTVFEEDTYISLPDLLADIDQIPCNHILVSINGQTLDKTPLSIKAEKKCPSVKRKRKCLEDKMGDRSRIIIMNSTQIGQADDEPGGRYPSTNLESALNVSLVDNKSMDEDGITTFSRLFPNLDLEDPTKLKYSTFGSHQCGSDFLFIPSEDFIENEDFEWYRESKRLVDRRNGQCDTTNYYKTIVVGKKLWILNMRFDEKLGSECYENEKINCLNYGRLYPWYSLDSICPMGWWVANENDWKEFIDLKGKGIAIDEVNNESKDNGKANKAYKNLVNEYIMLGGYKDSINVKFKGIQKEASHWSPRKYPKKKSKWAIVHKFDGEKKLVYKRELLRASKCYCNCVTDLPEKRSTKLNINKYSPNGKRSK